MIHLAGTATTFEHHIRQRCDWCGAALIDQDLRAVAVQVVEGEPPPPYPTWPAGSLIERDGSATYVVASADEITADLIRQLDQPACLAMPVEATA